MLVDAQTAAYVRSMLPRNVGKYWLQRYSLFSRYDEGVQVRLGDAAYILCQPSVYTLRPLLGKQHKIWAGDEKG